MPDSPEPRILDPVTTGQTTWLPVAQAPEHVIDNIKADEKAAAKGKKSKAMKKKPPEKGFVNWDEKTFRKLMSSPSEKLVSSFNMRHGMLLNVLSRTDIDGCEELRRIISTSHETTVKKKELRRRGFALFRGLVEGGVLTIIPKAERSGAAKVVLNVELQDDFTMNQALGLYLIDTIPQLDKESPDYVVNVISLVEAILEDPTAVIRKQLDKLKSELVAKLKDQGVEYDDRMEQLDEVEHPKPGKEFIYSTYNDFVLDNPWAKEAAVRPKSIAREMFENWQSFEDYVKSYGLERSEAVLLRHLSEVYKVLVQTVPPSAKTDDLEEAEAFLGEILRGVDSSLIDEWEKLKNPDQKVEEGKPVATAKPVPFSRRKAEFERAVRHAVFDFVKELSRGNLAEALDLVVGEMTINELGAVMETHSEEHGFIRMDPEARSAKHYRAEAIDGSRKKRIEQVLVDSEELNDWCVVFELDVEKSDERNAVELELIQIRPI